MPTIALVDDDHNILTGKRAGNQVAVFLETRA